MPSVNGGFSIQIHGLEEVRLKLRTLEKKMQAAVLKKGVYDGMVVIRDAARLRVPARGDRVNEYTRTGTLRKAIVADRKGVERDPKTKEFTTYAGVVQISKPRGKSKRNARKYAHLVEFGTKPHSVPYGGRYAGRKGAFRHPGAKAVHFMEGAFDAKKQEAINVAVASFKKAVNDAISGVSTLGRSRSK